MKTVVWSLGSILIVPAVLTIGGRLNSIFADEPPAVVNRGLVSLIDDVYVPAHRAGIVMKLSVIEGSAVKKDMSLAQIDVEQAEMEAVAAKAEKDAAIAKAESDVDVRHATATRSVADVEYRTGLEANKKSQNAVSKIELERMRLAVDQAALKIESSSHERSVRALESKVAEAHERLATLSVRQRNALSPIDGEVAETFVQAGEWIEPGKPLVRVIRLERLRVETFVAVGDRSPKELIGRSARIRVTLARADSQTFEGRVTFVSQIVQPGGDYRVWIEVANRRDGEHWLLRPGLEGEVTITP